MRVQNPPRVQDLGEKDARLSNRNDPASLRLRQGMSDFDRENVRSKDLVNAVANGFTKCQGLQRIGFIQNPFNGHAAIENELTHPRVLRE